jgi:hypothetical protein
MAEKEYATPLGLTTPNMRGPKVRDAQWLLAGHNRFPGLAPYKDGAIDSVYGTLTGQATRRAKYWLGYPDKALDTTFGQTLYEYLREKDWRPLPAAYKKRRDTRLKQLADATNPGALAFALAEKEIGYREEPQHGRNDNKYGREYGFNYVPWCAIFESVMFKHAGHPDYHYAAVQAIYWDAMANRNRLYIVRTPRQGDIVGYRLHGDEFAHTAFFSRWAGDGLLEDLGGNTGPSDISNGGMVMKQNRSTSIVHYYARVL